MSDAAGDEGRETDTDGAADGDGLGSSTPSPADVLGPIGPSDFECETAGSTAEIVFVYSVEKETLMDRVVDGFNSVGCGTVDGYGLPSGIQMSRLAAAVVASGLVLAGVFAAGQTILVVVISYLVGVLISHGLGFD